MRESRIERERMCGGGERGCGKGIPIFRKLRKSVGRKRIRRASAPASAVAETQTISPSEIYRCPYPYLYLYHHSYPYHHHLPSLLSFSLPLILLLLLSFHPFYLSISTPTILSPHTPFENPARIPSSFSPSIWKNRGTLIFQNHLPRASLSLPSALPPRAHSESTLSHPALSPTISLNLARSYVISVHFSRSRGIRPNLISPTFPRIFTPPQIVSSTQPAAPLRFFTPPHSRFRSNRFSISLRSTSRHFALFFTSPLSSFRRLFHRSL